MESHVKRVGDNAHKKYWQKKKTQIHWKHIISIQYHNMNYLNYLENERMQLQNKFKVKPD